MNIVSNNFVKFNVIYFNDCYYKFSIKVAREHGIYDLLETGSFKCICGRDSKHYPVRVKHNTLLDKVMLVTRKVGVPLHHIDRTQILEIHDIRQQIECISVNMVTNNITHGDLRDKNICVDTTGCLHLIDFDHTNRETIYTENKSCYINNMITQFNRIFKYMYDIDLK